MNFVETEANPGSVQSSNQVISKDFSLRGTSDIVLEYIWWYLQQRAISSNTTSISLQIGTRCRYQVTLTAVLHLTKLPRISLCANCRNLESWESPSYTKTLSITSNFDLLFGTSIAYYSRLLVTPLANMLQGPYYTQILMGINSMLCIWVLVKFIHDIWYSFISIQKLNTSKF